MSIQITRRILQKIGRPALGCRSRCLSTSNLAYDQCEGLDIKSEDQTLWLKFDRPKKYNAITREMYTCLTDIFNKANKDPSIKSVVITGNGDYYSSGNDLNNFILATQHEGGPKAGLSASKDILHKFVDSLINLEKFLIAGVNGPAVGIAVTTLPLCDYVIASEKATFATPFTALGQCPEACSSVTFPQIMGRSRSSELLLLNMTWDAKKARDYGLASNVIEADKFQSHLVKLTKTIAKTCYPNSLKISKSLILNFHSKKLLQEANDKECELILDAWLGEECQDAVQKFFERSKK